MNNSDNDIYKDYQNSNLKNEEVNTINNINNNSIENNSMNNSLYSNYINENNIKNDQINQSNVPDDIDKNTTEEKPYYIVSDDKIKKDRKQSKALFYSFYVIVILIGLVVFYMYRLDKYEFYLKNEIVNINKGSTYQIELTPKNIRYFDYLNYKYEIEDESIASVDEFGTIQSKEVGSTNVKIKYKNGFEYKTLKINIENVEIDKINIKVDNEISSDNANLNVNDSVKIDSIVNNRNDLNVNVEYRSNDESIVSVDEFGNVTAIQEGEATIIGETDDGIVGEITVKVEPEKKEIESINFVENNIQMKKGSKTKLNVSISPSDATGNLNYSSNNSNVSISDNGNVVANNIGTSLIAVKSDNGKIAYCTITVKEDEIPIESIDLNPPYLEIKKTQTYNLTASINPSNATLRDIVFESSDENVVTVNNGKIKAINVGEALITVRTTDGKVKTTSKIKVIDNVISVTNVNFKENNISLKLGSRVQLSPTITPLNATNKTLSWSSNNSNIVVDKTGMVTAKAVGKSIVTATSVNGLKATCTIDVQEETIDVKGITLSKEKQELNLGDSFELTYEINPSNATIRDVKWSSSNPSVATVNNGKIIAKGKGETVIKITTSNGKTASCKIIVKVPVTSLSLSGFSTMKVKDSKTLDIQITPSDASDKTLKWESSNSSVATISSSGKINAKKVGTTVITATSSNGIKASKTITVKENEIVVSKISINPNSIELKEGETASLSVILEPINATNQKVSWKSSNDGVATISSSGKLKALKKGTTTITVKSSNGKSATCKVVVNENIIRVSKVKLNISETTKYVGETVTLKATIEPSNATNKSITWKSNKEKVAVVDKSGKVTTKGVGTAVITATVDGISTTSVIKVKQRTIDVSAIELDKTNVTLKNNNTLTLKATITPSDASNKTLTWTSSNPSVATVNESGKVTAKEVGTATITAKSSNGKVKATCKVTVLKENIINVSSISVNRESSYMFTGEKQTLTITVNPSNATNKTVTWKSSDPSIATVNESGVVTAKKGGKVTISATSSNGKVGKTTITILYFINSSNRIDYELDSSKLKKVIEIDYPDKNNYRYNLGISAAQGIDITNKYLIITYSKWGSNTNTIDFYNKNTYNKVNTKKIDLGHANDLTYNSKRKEIVFLKAGDNLFNSDNKDKSTASLVVMDENTLNIKKEINLMSIANVPNSLADLAAIAYSSTGGANNEGIYYIGVYRYGYIIDAKKINDYIDGKINSLSSSDLTLFSTYTKRSKETGKGGMSIQTFEFSNNILYASATADNYYNQILAFNKNGELVKDINLKTSLLGELEGIAVDSNSNTYILSNNWYDANGTLNNAVNPLKVVVYKLTKNIDQILNQ